MTIEVTIFPTWPANESSIPVRFTVAGRFGTGGGDPASGVARHGGADRGPVTRGDGGDGEVDCGTVEDGSASYVNNRL